MFYSLLICFALTAIPSGSSAELTPSNPSETAASDLGGNDVRTKSILGHIWNHIHVCHRVRDENFFHENEDYIDVMLYHYLGYEPSDGSYYTPDVWRYLEFKSDVLNDPTRVFSQEWAKRHDNREQPSDSLWDAYATGDYFQMVNPDASYSNNERIIVNFTNQENAAWFANTFDTDWFVDQTQANSEYVGTIKYLASERFNLEDNWLIVCKDEIIEQSAVKCDKVVIYYWNDEDNTIRNQIYGYIVNETMGMRSPNLSAFYFQLGPGIGYGPEIQGTSFTNENVELLKALLSTPEILNQSEEAFTNEVYSSLVSEWYW